LTGLFELRTIVEPAAAALAAARRSREQLRAMRLALEAMSAESLAVEAGRQADRQFHSVLLEASGNPFLASLISGIAAAVTWTTIFKQRGAPLARNPLPDHRRVYEAVDRRDPAAARAAMTDLVRLALLDTTRARAGAPIRTRPAARSARRR
ncbi:GntR domain-containing protein, partial [mine drainage metagenome]